MLYPPLSDGQGHLVRLHIHFSFFIGVVQLDGTDLSRAKGALDKESWIIGVIDHIDVFIYEFPHDSMDPGPFHADAGPDRIDAVIIGFNSNFSTFPGTLTIFLIVIRPS